MKHIYLLVDSRKEQRAVTPVIEVSNRIYKKAKELLTLNQYNFSEYEDKNENGIEIKIHKVKLNDSMPCSLAKFILENL